jgi:hypothetical protein
VDQYGMGNDSQSTNGMIQDPGFESQAKYHVLDTTAATTIPTVSTVVNQQYNYYPAFDQTTLWFPIREMLQDTAYVNDWAPKYYQDDFEPVGAHRWLQTDDSVDRWSVDLTDFHNLGVGEVGQASAQATIGANGYTNWLIPFDVDYWIDNAINDAVNQWRIIRSVPEMPNDTMSQAYGAGVYGSVPPAYIEGFEGFMYVKSDDDVTVEVSATLSVEGYYETFSNDPRERGTKVFPDTAYQHYGGQGDPDSYSYREIAEVEFSQLSASGGWNRVAVELPYTGFRGWPNAYSCLDEENEPDDYYWTFRYRAKGTPGTVVSFDNIYLDRQYRGADVPILTVGVDEWILDEAGVYIGAKLWIKMGQPTGYCVGAPEGGG